MRKEVTLCGLVELQLVDDIVDARSCCVQTKCSVSAAPRRSSITQPKPAGHFAMTPNAFPPRRINLPTVHNSPTAKCAPLCVRPHQVHYSCHCNRLHCNDWHNPQAPASRLIERRSRTVAIAPSVVGSYATPLQLRDDPDMSVYRYSVTPTMTWPDRNLMNTALTRVMVIALSGQPGVVAVICHCCITMNKLAVGRRGDGSNAEMTENWDDALLGQYSCTMVLTEENDRIMLYLPPNGLLALSRYGICDLGSTKA